MQTEVALIKQVFCVLERRGEMETERVVCGRNKMRITNRKRDKKSGGQKLKRNKKINE